MKLLALLMFSQVVLAADNPMIGQATMALSQPVAIASDQSSLSVTGPLTDVQLRATAVPVSGTVTANAGTNLNTSALALDTSVSGILLSQGSTTSGQKGPLLQGAVSTSAPSYTTAQTSPVSLTTSGALRADLSSRSDVTKTYTFNAPSQDFDIDCTGLSTLRIQVTGTWVGSISWLESTNGTDFDPAAEVRDAYNPTTQADDPLLANETVLVPVTGIKTFRMTNSVFGWTSGAASVTAIGSTSQSTITAIAAQVGIQGDVRIRSSDDIAINIGQHLMAASVPVVIASDQSSFPVTIAAGSAVMGHVITDSGSTTVVTGNVATTAADGSNVTLGAKADAKSTATDTTAISIMSVLKEISAMEQAPASRAVTNAGTFVTQSTLAAETTKVIGTVNVAASQTIGISAGSAVIGHVINDASSAVIGHVIADTGSTTAVTGNVASTVADGADVTLGAKTDAKSTATDTTAVTAMSVLKEISAMEQAPASRAVTNAGTFAVQATLADTVATGNITTQNLNPNSGTATAASTIGLSSMAANSTVAIQVTGTYTGALTPQISVDGSNWITLTALTNANTGAQSATIASAATGIWIGKVPAAIKFRISANSAVTGTATVSVQSSLANGLTTIDTPLPTGANVLGHVIADSGSTTAVTGTVTANATLSAETTKVIGTVNQGTSPWVGNVSQINGVTPLMGNGGTGTGSQRVTIASDNTAFTVNAAESGTWTVQPGNTANTTPWLMTINDGTNSAKVQAASTAAVAADKALTVVQSPNGLNPCVNSAATLVSITGATSTTNATQIVALSGTTKIYVCSMTVIGVSGTSPTFGLVSGTGSNCASSQTTVVQNFSTTANQLYQFANPVLVTTAGHALCYKDGGTAPVQNYQITYVQQ